jgi:hypothetical protein
MKAAFPRKVAAATPARFSAFTSNISRSHAAELRFPQENATPHTVAMSAREVKML